LNNPARKQKSRRFSEEMIQDCLQIMKEGSAEDLFALIPAIGVLRDPSFREPLLSLLAYGDPKKREFAAYSMGAMGDREFLEPLKQAFCDLRKTKRAHVEDLLIAIIESIGEVGDDAAVEFFLPLLQEPAQGRQALRMRRWIVESLGSITQQGGARSEAALLELTRHEDPALRAQAVSELSVAYWHRPEKVPKAILDRICEMMRDGHPAVTEAALAALQSLADVGCRRAERMFE
jgi:HEAT repeat protein